MDKIAKKFLALVAAQAYAVEALQEFAAYSQEHREELEIPENVFRAGMEKVSAALDVFQTAVGAVTDPMIANILLGKIAKDAEQENLESLLQHPHAQA